MALFRCGLARALSALGLAFVAAACSSPPGGSPPPSGGGSDAGGGLGVVASSSTSGAGGGATMSSGAGGADGCANAFFRPNDGVVSWAMQATCGAFQRAAALSPDGGSLVVNLDDVGAASILGGALTVESGPDQAIAGVRADGTFTWLKPLVGDDVGVASIFANDDGSAAIGGYFGDTADLGSGTIGHPASVLNEGYFARYDATGALTSLSTLLSPTSTYWTEVDSVTLGGRGFVFSGSAQSGDLTVAGLDLPAVTAHDAIVGALDASGAGVWAARFGAGKSADAIVARTDAAGDVFLLGTYQGALDLGGGLVGTDGGMRERWFLAELDPHGAPLWLRDYPGTVNNFVTIALDDAGALYAFGFTDPLVDFGAEPTWPLSSTFTSNILVAKYGAGGAVSWVASYDGSPHIQSGAFAVTGDGRPIVVEGHPRDLRVRTLGADGSVPAVSVVFDSVYDGNGGYPVPYDVFPLPSGDLVLIGQFWGDLKLGSVDLATDHQAGTFMALITP